MTVRDSNVEPEESLSIINSLGHSRASSTHDDSDSNSLGETVSIDQGSDLDEFLSDLLRTASNDAGNQLKPISPEEGVNLYLKDRESELRESSLQSHKSGLKFFLTFCDKNEIHNLNDLDGRILQQYRHWRRDEATVKVERLAKETEKTQQDIIRQFAKFLVSIDAVDPDLPSKIRSPSISSGEASRTTIVESERANQILNWLRKYDYASTKHTLFEILSGTGVRIGLITALDLEDYVVSENGPHLRARHRPERGTPLKNGSDSERLIALPESMSEVLNDYIENRRIETTDDYGRDPLVTTEYGRISSTTVRQYVYRLTQPCTIGESCPHNRDVESCVASTSNSQASKCPSSRSPHAIRRGYITHELKTGINRSYVSDRCDVSEDVIEEHYDERNESERMAVRAQAIHDAHRTASGYGGASK